MRTPTVLLLTLLALPALKGQGKFEFPTVNDAGLGFAMTSDGQSIFYYRGTSPFRLYQGYLTAGIHQADTSINIPFVDPFTGVVYSNPNRQTYFEFGLGGRRLVFQGKLAGGLFPYLTVQAGATGYLSQLGTFRGYFAETALQWAGFYQLAAGAGVHAGIALYRLEIGYMASLVPQAAAGFPPYQGVFFKIILSSGKRPD